MVWPGEIVLCNVMLALSAEQLTTGTLSPWRSRECAGKTAGQPHHMSVVRWRLIASAAATTGGTAWSCPIRKYAFSTMRINAVIAAAQEILIKSAQPVAHGWTRYIDYGLEFKLPRRGPFLRSGSPRKSVALIIRNRAYDACCRRVMTVPDPSC